jgi:hypothetical protein
MQAAYDALALPDFQTVEPGVAQARYASFARYRKNVFRRFPLN